VELNKTLSIVAGQRSDYRLQTPTMAFKAIPMALSGTVTVSVIKSKANHHGLHRRWACSMS